MAETLSINTPRHNQSHVSIRSFTYKGSTCQSCIVPQVNLIRLISKSTMHNTASMWREQQTINMFVTALTFFSTFLVSLLPKILSEVEELGAGGYTIDHVKV